MAAKAITGYAFEGKSLVLLARLVNTRGETMGADDVDTLTYDVWKMPVPFEWRLGAGTVWTDKYKSLAAPVNFSETVDVDVVLSIYDELQVDDRWSIDTVGYNMAIVVPEAKVPTLDINDYPKSLPVAYNVTVTPVVVDALLDMPIPVNYMIEVKQFLAGKGDTP